MKVSKDPDDDKFLAAAAGGLAHYLVTGDIKDLLGLGEYKGTRIVSPDQFLAIRTPKSRLYCFSMLPM